MQDLLTEIAASINGQLSEKLNELGLYEFAPDNLIDKKLLMEALSNKNLVIDLTQLFYCIDYTDNFLMGLENYKKET